MIELKHVSFAYEKDRPVLQDISFRVKHCQAVIFPLPVSGINMIVCFCIALEQKVSVRRNLDLFLFL